MSNGSNRIYKLATRGFPTEWRTFPLFRCIWAVTQIILLSSFEGFVLFIYLVTKFSWLVKAYHIFYHYSSYDRGDASKGTCSSLVIEIYNKLKGSRDLRSYRPSAIQVSMPNVIESEQCSGRFGIFMQFIALEKGGRYISHIFPCDVHGGNL